VLDNPYEQILWHHAMRGIPRIAEAPSERGIPVKSLLTYHPPLVYILVDRELSFSPEEEAVVQRYLDGGGIVLVESVRPGNPALREHLRGLAQRLWSDGKRKVVPSLETIPADHPLYHAFHDFPDGAPAGAGQNLGAVTHRVQPHLEAVMKDGKLIVIFSDKGYGLSWAAEEYGSDAMKMGVNLVIYALVQQGGKPGHRTLARE